MFNRLHENAQTLRFFKGNLKAFLVFSLDPHLTDRWSYHLRLLQDLLSFTQLRIASENIDIYYMAIRAF